MTTESSGVIWYCLVGDNTIGPAADEHILDAIQRGTVTAQCRVRRSNEDAWSPISEVPAFAQALTRRAQLAAFDSPPPRAAVERGPSSSAALGAFDSPPPRDEPESVTARDYADEGGALGVISAQAENGTLFGSPLALLMRMLIVVGAFVPFGVVVLALQAENVGLGLASLGAAAGAFLGGAVLWGRSERLLQMQFRARVRYPITPIAGEFFRGMAEASFAWVLCLALAAPFAAVGFSGTAEVLLFALPASIAAIVFAWFQLLLVHAFTEFGLSMVSMANVVVTTQKSPPT